MPEFDELREHLREARGAAEAAGDEVAAARERLKGIRAREAELERVFHPEDDERAAELARLHGEREQARAELGRRLDEQGQARGAAAELLRRFAAFTDPREAIGRLDDRTPILLMPVRLETRFKTVERPVTGAAPARELWVRIYPDDCWVDGFDPVLTETEVEGARTYWVGIWKAGGIEDQERGAWRTLAIAHGSGRAAWIVSQYQPLNLAARPAKASPDDVVLTIPTAAPLPSAEEAAAGAFWRAAWLADGDAAATGAARSALETVVGAARAAEIVATHQPANFAAPLPGGGERADVAVTAAFVVFPPVETKQNAWSRAPRVRILPDRFVFIGYQGELAPVVAIGAPVTLPLAVGPDPSGPEAEQLQHDAAGNLVVPDEMRWMVDFDRAVAAGMGLRIGLTAAQAERGFDRVLVVGVRLSADQRAGKAELEELLRHHSFSRRGLAVVPQGTPTNNTEGAGSGFARLDDPDQSFDDLRSPRFAPATDPREKRDGQWLAEYLGVDPALFLHTHGAGATDQRAARAMNEALWPATLGYWMETMMSPVFSREAIENTRDFFTRFVVAGGAVPAIRVGRQPYGILPATALSRMRWFGRRDALGYLGRLYALLRAVDADWDAVRDVSFVGKAGDPHRTLLDIVGLHPGSVEWSQRYAESLRTVFNRLNLLGFGGMIQALLLALQRQAARDALVRLGAGEDAAPPLLDKIFSGRHNELRGGVVDDRPLSESETIRAYTPGGANYLQWLIDAAGVSLDALYRQDGFTDDRPPAALLYLLLRHALQLGYHDVSVRLHEDAGLYTAEAAVRARLDDPFLHIRQGAQVSESRYQPLYAAAPAITGHAAQPVHRFISSRLTTLGFAWRLREQLAALERLKREPTGRLERVFADHVDCCSYRIDAWQLGLVNVQLAQMRNLLEQEGEPRDGIYLGAYAWLEEVRPERKDFTPVVLRDPDLAEQFGEEGQPPLARDSTNQGFVHAPSLNHAVAAAVLRNGFISNASPANRQTMAVNLTSERVRTALALLEGVRAGQGLADLLGYQFERGLHDRHGLAEVDKFIFKLRRAFPLRAGHLRDTQPPEGVPIEAIEARNVIDGLAFAEHMKRTGERTYPFGKPGLPTATDPEAEAINAEADRVLEAHDAVADLALAEGVYQAVLGNYDRVASTYDAYARGSFPPEPEVVRTPLNGVGLTHRVGLHLRAGADPDASPVAGVPMTPRAQAEPAVNQWLEAVLPAPDQVGCTATFRDAATGAMQTREVTLRQLELQPADLLAVVGEPNAPPMSELDDRVVRRVKLAFAARPDTPVTIEYLRTLAAPLSVFQLSPLVRSLRALVTRSRPLRATDLALGNEARSGHDAARFIDQGRLERVRNGLLALRGDLVLFAARLAGPLSDLDNRRGEILADADDYVADGVELLARAAAFALPQSGWGFAYDFQRRTFAAVLGQAAALVARWDDRLAEFQGVLDEEAALPGTSTDARRFRVLQRGERVLTTAETSPLPATPALFRTHLETVLRPAFQAKQAGFAALQATTRTGVVPLLGDVAALLPVAPFDPEPYSLADHENQMVRFTEDLLAVVRVVLAEAERRLGASQDAFDRHDASAPAETRVAALEEAAAALLGPDFRVVPEFDLAAAQGDEIDNALAASRAGTLFDHLRAPPDPSRPPDEFPVDTWLYGVARVRDKVHAWEQTVMLTGSLGRPEPALDAMQLPFTPDDRWLGLEFPPKQPLDRDRLLYTAHFATGTFDRAARQCGLLLDEWTETIPTADVDTGIVFHHDRPNCEAPQAMLLVTPSEFRGAWVWDDLVDTLNETLAFAKRRAIEPVHVDHTAYAPFLPATIMATQVAQLTIAADLAMNNRVAEVLRKE